MGKLAELEMRQAYAVTVGELFAADPNVFALEADLSNAMATLGLRTRMGANYVNAGIMEAHLVSAAAGVALAGGFPFVHSFGQFLARRAMDQIFVSLAYSGLSACLVGSDAGVTAEHNGGTHMTFEDAGILRVIPGIYLYDVSDPVQLGAVLVDAHARGGLTYVRTFRKRPGMSLYADGTRFDGGARVLREGSDVSLVACGTEVAEALAAAELLAEYGVSAEVIDCYRIKPLDAEVLLASAAKTRRVVTCENHSTIGALGSAVAELLSTELPAPQRMIGVRESFGQVGTTRYLLDEYGLSAESIRNCVLTLVEPGTQCPSRNPLTAG